MKINFGAALTGLAGLRLGFDRLSSSRTLRFEGSRDHARALKAAFKGRIEQSGVLATSDGPQVLRPGKSGLFNLKSFQRVFSPPAPPRDAAPPGALPQAPDPSPIQQPDRAVVDGAAHAPPAFEGRLLAATQSQVPQLNADVAHWRHCERAMHRAPTSVTAMRQAALGRAVLEQRIGDGLKELRALDACIDDDAHPSAATPAARAAVETTRQAFVAAAIALALPELWHPPQEAAPQDSDANLQDLQRALLALHDRAAAAGGKPMALDRLLATFANQQRIREIAGSPLGATRADAVVALTHILDTVTTAVGPGRDGSSLNALIGISGELDDTLKALRVDATRAFMLQRAAQDLNLAVDALPREATASAAADARAVVDLEFGIAGTKRMIRRALEQDGGAGSSGWTGHKVDATLVDGLRKTLGASAKETGLIVAGLVAAERALAASPAARRLLQDVRQELRQARAGRTDGGGGDTAPKDRIAYLEARERALQTEEGLLVGRLVEANDNLRGLLAESKLRAESKNALPAELEAVQSRVGMALRAQDYWEARWRAISLPPELKQARAQIDALDHSIAELDGRIQAQELAETVERHRGFAPAASEGSNSERLRGERADTQARRDEAMRSLLDQQVQHAAASGSNAHWGGLTQDELTALGLAAVDARQAIETAQGLARRGLTSAAQAAGMVSQVNSVMGALRGKRFGVEASAGRASGQSNAETNADRAKVLSGALQRRLIGDSTPEKPVGESMREKLAPPGGVLWPITEAADPSQPASPVVHAADSKLQDLQVHAHCHVRLEKELFDLCGAHETLQQQKQDARDALRRFNGAAGGRHVDLDRPAGLRSATRLREAIDLYRATAGLANATARQRERFDALRGQLRGFDADTLTSAWHGGAALTIAQVRTLAGRRDLDDAIDAVILLREEAPAAQARIEDEIATTTAAIDATILERGRLMGAEAYGALRDATRLAVLEQLEAAGGDAAHFLPSAHAAAIKERLAAWGVPVSAARPEIDSFLSQSFGPDELNLWMRQAAFTGSERTRMRDDLSRRAAEPSRATSPGVRPETRKALLDGVDRLSVGSKVSLAAGDRVEVQTGSIAVEPTGVLGVNVKVAVGRVHGLEIARYPDGYELVVRSGWDGKAGAEVSAKVWQAKAIGLRADAGATIEAEGYRMDGVALRFANTAAGREAMKAMLDNLVSKGEIEARDFCAAENVMAVVEHRVGAKVGAGAKVGFDYGTSSSPAKPAGSDFASVAIGARAAVAAGVAQTRSVTESPGLVIYKGEREVSVEISAAAGASWRLGLAAGPGKTHNTASEALEVSASAAFACRVKSREVRGLDGQVQAGAQYVVQAYLPPRGKEAAVGALGGAEFRELVGRLRRSEHPEDRGLLADLATLVDSAGPNDSISIVSSLDERVLRVVNEKLTQAQALRRERGEAGDSAARASELEDQAQALLDDRGSYIVSKLWLMPTADTMQTLVPLNLMFVRLTASTRLTDAQVRAQVDFDPRLARAAHDAVANSPIR